MVRVERILSSSALICAITAAAPTVSSRKTSSSEEPSATSSCIGHPGGERDVADALARRSVHEQRVVVARGASRCRARFSASASFAGSGVRIADRAADARGQLLERRLDDELAAVDDQHLVDGLRDLCEHVARDEHGPLPGGERAQEVAQPAHAFRVEPVCRLVEDQQLGVAEQRGGEPEPLAHAERVPLDAAASRRVELDQPQHLLDPRVAADPTARAERAQVVAARAARVEVGRLEHRADPQRGPLERRVGLAEDERAAARRRREPEQHPQRRRLAGAVRAEEAGDRARLEREREIVDRDQLPNRFVNDSASTTLEDEAAFSVAMSSIIGPIFEAASTRGRRTGW